MIIVVATQNLLGLNQMIGGLLSLFISLSSKEAKLKLEGETTLTGGE